MFKKFIERNISEIEKKGTEKQLIRVVGVVAELSQNMGELSDFMGGRRKLGDHSHHDPKHLAEVAIGGIVNVVKIRREIG